jgi:hypothetical protein
MASIASAAPARECLDGNDTIQRRGTVDQSALTATLSKPAPWPAAVNSRELERLVEAYWNDNQLTGSLPNTIGQWTNLLTGTVPSGMCALAA